MSPRLSTLSNKFGHFVGGDMSIGYARLSRHDYVNLWLEVVCTHWSGPAHDRLDVVGAIQERIVSNVLSAPCATDDDPQGTMITGTVALGMVACHRLRAASCRASNCSRVI